MQTFVSTTNNTELDFWDELDFVIDFSEKGCTITGEFVNKKHEKSRCFIQKKRLNLLMKTFGDFCH